MGTWNTRYVAYARAHHVDDPDEMLRRDEVAWPGGRMTGFIVWLGQVRRNWGAEIGITSASDLRYNELPDAEEWFDLWLQASFC